MMPKRKAAEGSWNCMGKSELLTTIRRESGGAQSKKKEVMEGSAYGLSNTLHREGSSNNSDKG